MKYDSRIRRNAFDNFDRDFNRAKKMIKVWFVLIALIFFSVIGFYAFIAYNVITNPSGVGNIIADVARPIIETVKE